MKKLWVLIFMTILFAFPVKIWALSTDSTNYTYQAGETKQIDLYANLEEETEAVSFALYYTSNDVRADFKVADGRLSLDGSKYTISYDTLVSGKVKLGSIMVYISGNPTDGSGNINITNAKGYNENDESFDLNALALKINISKNINNDTPSIEKKEEVKKEEPKKEENKKEEEKVDNKEEIVTYNLLKEITSEIVKLNIKDNIYEYSINIDEEVKELDLEAIPYDEKTKVEIGKQKISELKDNKIVIKATDKDGHIQEYIIKVNINMRAKINNSEFKVDTSYKGKWVLLTIVLLISLGIGLVLIKKK